VEMEVEILEASSVEPSKESSRAPSPYSKDPDYVMPPARSPSGKGKGGRGVGKGKGGRGVGKVTSSGRRPAPPPVAVLPSAPSPQPQRLSYSERKAERQRREEEAERAKREKRVQARHAGQTDGPVDGRAGHAEFQARVKFHGACIKNIKKFKAQLAISDAVIAAIEAEVKKDEWGGCLRPYMNADRTENGLPPITDRDWDDVCVNFEELTGANYSTRTKGFPTDVIKRASLFSAYGETRLHQDLRRSKTGRPQQLPNVRIVCSWQSTVDEGYIPPSTLYQDQHDGTMVVDKMVTRAERDAELLKNAIDLANAPDLTPEEEERVRVAQEAARAAHDGHVAGDQVKQEVAAPPPPQQSSQERLLSLSDSDDVEDEEDEEDEEVEDGVEDEMPPGPTEWSELQGHAASETDPIVLE